MRRPSKFPEDQHSRRLGATLLWGVCVTLVVATWRGPLISQAFSGTLRSTHRSAPPTSKAVGGSPASDSERAVIDVISPRRSTLLAALALWTPRPASAVDDAAKPVAVYFGHGSFWRLQHNLTLWSLRTSKAAAPGLYPDGSFSPAFSGYAGGKGRDNDGKVCYTSMNGDGYDKMGYSEVVGLELPSGALEDIARLYFNEVSSGPRKQGPKDGISSQGVVSGGSAYRSTIGLPGGLGSPLFPALERANAGRLKLLPGVGKDPDTLDQRVVYLYDTKDFPFNRAELYHQYHDDVSEPFSKGYRGLKARFEQAKVLGRTGCAE